ncbi:zinc finger protein 37 [Elysia marginata]|uniref:Zinc finger protein 37 n=1 Tax=Elysia marginata TaxID=1093978 RepID=A0AAV4ETY8_9GAST|nr:zinc finger protein 37 [Elysia marginata]
MGWWIPFTDHELKATIKECPKQISIEQVRKPIAASRKTVRAVVQLEGDDETADIKSVPCGTYGLSELRGRSITQQEWQGIEMRKRADLEHNVEKPSASNSFSCPSKDVDHNVEVPSISNSPDWSTKGSDQNIEKRSVASNSCGSSTAKPLSKHVVGNETYSTRRSQRCHLGVPSGCMSVQNSRHKSQGEERDKPQRTAFTVKSPKGMLKGASSSSTSESHPRLRSANLSNPNSRQYDHAVLQRDGTGRGILQENSSHATGLSLSSESRQQTTRDPHEMRNSKQKHGNCRGLSAHKPNSVNKKFRCLDCNQTFSTGGYLKYHFKQHLGERPYKCDVCNKSFSQKVQVHSHLKTHLGVHEQYICDVCGKIYTWKYNFISHMSQHKGESLYKCQTCGKSFLSRGNLNKHQRNHTVYNFHKCDVCGKWFPRHCDLKRHIRTHLKRSLQSSLTDQERSNVESKLYRCDLCYQFFTSSSCLLVHKKRHYGIRQFACVHCGRAFFRKPELRVHERKHTGEKPYSCDLCGKRFADKSALRQHNRRHLKYV